jgi:hypothetical protein
MIEHLIVGLRGNYNTDRIKDPTRLARGSIH